MAILKLADIRSQPDRRRFLWMSLPVEYLNLAVTLLQGLILVPLYLRYIGSHTYGFWLATGGILTWLGVFDLGIGPMMNQRIAHAYGERKFSKITELVLSGFAINVGIALVFLLVGCVGAILIPNVFHLDGQEATLLQSCFLLAVIGAALNILNGCLLSFASAMLRPIFPTLSLLICRVFGLTVTIVLLLDAYGLRAIPIGALATAVSGFLLNCIYSVHMLRQLGGRIVVNKDVVKSYMAASPALIAGKWGGVLAKDVEPFFITLFLSPEAATDYTVILRAGTLVAMALNTIVGAITPVFSHILGGEGRERILKVSKAVLWGFFWLGIVGFSIYTILDKSFVSLWVGTVYSEDLVDLIPVLGIYLFVFTFRNLFSGLLIASGDIAMPSWMLLAEACLRVALIVIFLKAFGLYGVPVAMAISCAILSTILGLRFAARIGIRIDKNAMFYALFVCCLIFGSATLMADARFLMTKSWWVFVAHTVGSLAILTVLLICLYYRKVGPVWRTIHS